MKYEIKNGIKKYKEEKIKFLNLFFDNFENPDSAAELIIGFINSIRLIIIQ